MKKIFLLSIILVTLTGCTSIQKSSINSIINDSLNSLVKATNTNRKGYKYYLPSGMKHYKTENFSETLTDKKYLYYLYVDIVSFNNQTAFTYTKNSNAYYSENIINKNNLGYIEINNYKNNQYLIEIMYNYAKIEVVVYEQDLNLSVAYAMTILKSITYNSSVIKNYLESNTLDSVEETFNIFKIEGSENYLQFSEETEENNTNKDTDYIK